MASFPTTRWSVVLDAAGPEPRRSAMSQLCSAYWPSVFAFIRRKVDNPEEAKDITQAFFLRLLEKHDLMPARSEHARFRSFLLASVQHFLSNQRDHDRAQKRGAGITPIPLDFDGAALRYEPHDTLTPEKIFEQQWAATLLDRTLQTLRCEFETAGRGAQFQALKDCLAGEPSLTYAQIGDRLGMTEGAVKTAVHRMRRRYRDLLRDEIAETVADPAEIDDELQYLFSVVSS